MIYFPNRIKRSRNQQRSIESMQMTLDSESKARQEAVRIKKKMEGDLNDLEIQLGHSNRQASESQKLVKSVQAHVKVNPLQTRSVKSIDKILLSKDLKLCHFEGFGNAS